MILEFELARNSLEPVTLACRGLSWDRLGHERRKSPEYFEQKPYKRFPVMPSLPLNDSMWLWLGLWSYPYLISIVNVLFFKQLGCPSSTQR